MNKSQAPTGSGVRIAIVDTGCSLHKDIVHAIKRRITLYRNDDLIHEDLDDENGHGTFVAGIIEKIAPDSEIVAIKAACKDGKTDYYLIGQAIYCAVLEKCDIINISIGGDFYDEKLHKAVEYAHEKGSVMVCASGNDGHIFNVNLIDYPAKFKETIAVGGCDDEKNLALFSTIGKEIDFVAPSIDITSTFLNNTYKTMSGTSFAAPYVTGMIALYLSIPENKNKSVTELKTALIKASIDLGQQGKDVYFGNGIINVNKILKNNVGTLKLMFLRIKGFFRRLFC